MRGRCGLLLGGLSALVSGLLFSLEQGGFYLWLVLRRLLSPLRSFEVLSLLAGEIGVSLGYILF